MRDFAKRVAAHICTWFIVQPLYNRILKLWRQRELESPSEESHAYWKRQADSIVDVMEERGHLVRPAQAFHGKPPRDVPRGVPALYVAADESHKLADEIMGQLAVRHNPVELHAIRESVKAAIEELS